MYSQKKNYIKKNLICLLRTGEKIYDIVVLKTTTTKPAYWGVWYHVLRQNLNLNAF